MVQYNPSNTLLLLHLHYSWLHSEAKGKDCKDGKVRGLDGLRDSPWAWGFSVFGHAMPCAFGENRRLGHWTFRGDLVRHGPYRNSWVTWLRRIWGAWCHYELVYHEMLGWLRCHSGWLTVHWNLPSLDIPPGTLHNGTYTYHILFVMWFSTQHMGWYPIHTCLLRWNGTFF